MKRYSIILLLFLLCNTLFAQQYRLNIGLFADCQSAQSERNGSRFYTKSPAKLAEAIETFNNEKVDMIVSLGDFVDADIASMEELVPIAAKATSHIYHMLGNHDFLQTDFDRALEIMDIKAPYYYSVVQNGVRLVMLNSNERTIYSTQEGTSDRKDAEVYIAQLKDDGALNALPYNGAIGPKQLEWLESELQLAEKSGEIVVVMSHHPLLYPIDVITALNSKQVRGVLEKYSCVKAHISGHHHMGGYSEVNGIHYLILKGMVDTENNRYAIAKIYDDRIEIDGRADEKDITLKYIKK